MVHIANSNKGTLWWITVWGFENLCMWVLSTQSQRWRPRFTRPKKERDLFQFVNILLKRNEGERISLAANEKKLFKKSEKPGCWWSRISPYFSLLSPLSHHTNLGLGGFGNNHTIQGYRVSSQAQKHEATCIPKGTKQWEKLHPLSSNIMALLNFSHPKETFFLINIKWWVC